MSIAADTEVGVTAQGNTVSWSEIQDAVRKIRAHLSTKLTTGACATRFLFELASHWCGMPQSFGGNVVLVDVDAVIDQIALMERGPHARAIPTKAATQFDTGPLRGLWHKHWFQASIIPQNLANEMERHGASLIFRRLSERYGSNGWSSRTIDREMVDLLAHASVFDAMDQRAGNTARGSRPCLTGEWIVFAKTGARNVYLTLGGHHETNDAILARCLPTQREFNELASIEPFNK